MKTLYAALAFAALAADPAFAQAPAPPPERGSPAAVDAIRQAARDDKRGLVAKNLQLTDAEGKKFWPVYDAFQKELDKIVQRQNRAVLDYVNTESSLTDGNAKRIAREVLETDAAEQKLREQHHKRVTAVLPARKAVRYLQIENKLRALARYDMAAQIPLVK